MAKVTLPSNKKPRPSTSNKNSSTSSKENTMSISIASFLVKVNTIALVCVSENSSLFLENMPFSAKLNGEKDSILEEMEALKSAHTSHLHKVRKMVDIKKLKEEASFLKELSELEIRIASLAIRACNKGKASITLDNEISISATYDEDEEILRMKVSDSVEEEPKEKERPTRGRKPKIEEEEEEQPKKGKKQVEEEEEEEEEEENIFTLLENASGVREAKRIIKEAEESDIRDFLKSHNVKIKKSTPLKELQELAIAEWRAN